MPYNQLQLDNVQFIYDFFNDRGWSTQAIAGMLGNMETESYLYADIWEGGSEPGTGTGPGYGLVQWTPAENLINWAEENDLDYTQIETQCLRIQFEFENNEQYIPTDEYPITAEEFMISTEAPSTLAMVFLYNYERPASYDQPQRSDQAEYWYEYLTNGDNGPVRPGQHIITFGHDPENTEDGEYGATAIDGATTESALLRGDLRTSLIEYAEESEANIEFYDGNMYADGTAENYIDYSSITELHFDGRTDSSIQGGHVIVAPGEEPSEMNNQFITLIETHVGVANDIGAYDNTRTDIANVNIWANAGANFNYVELAMITNQEDFDYILENYDSLAYDIIDIIAFETNGNGEDSDPDDPTTYTVQSGDTLTSIAAEFGVTIDQLVEWNNLSDPDDIQVGQELTISDPGNGEDPDPDPDPEPGDSISAIQEWLNSNYNSGLEVDGIFGAATNEAVVSAVQTELNSQLGAGLVVDGSFGPLTQLAWPYQLNGGTGNLVYLIQAQIIGAGYDPNGFDGIFGDGLESAVIQFQTDEGIEVDGIVGVEAAYALFNHTQGWHWDWIPNPDITEVQQWLNNNCNSGLLLDGSSGPNTREALVRAVQTQLNADYNAGLVVDGFFGQATQSAWQFLQQGDTGNLVQLVQGRLIGAGYDPQGFDGSFGPGMEAAVTEFQTAQNIEVDGIVGAETSYTLFNF